MDGLENLINLINNEVYEPFKNIFNSSPVINALTDALNNLLIALFGHTSNITTDNISALLTAVILGAVLAVVINLFITAFQTFTGINKKGRK